MTQANDVNRVQFKRVLGRILRRERQAKRLTQQELAAQIGTTPAALSAWELGKVEPDNKNFRAVIGALGLDVVAVFTELDRELGGAPLVVAETPRALAIPDSPHLNKEWQERRAFTALVDALRELDQLDTRDPRAWRARLAWLAVIGASTVVRELAGWTNDRWAAIYEGRVDYWKKPARWRRSEERTAAEWLQRTFEFSEEPR